MPSNPEIVVSIVAGVFLLIFGEAIANIFGLLVFAILTLGFIRVQGPEDRERVFPWHGFARNEAGKLVVQTEMAGGIGMITGIAVCVFLWRYGVFTR
ncbi:hypothetical protein EH244_31630 [Variovorax beijingensis]|uniref:Uncharacterized protein n=1 Tax=Variovorax beijingensis TaxID=2496117 RepID=A0A3P3E0H1_9BURK|nr:hypothetical protein [Variovorax beijingensis]RRH79734.1 hypothetical protein EH244_31630 [Variovorax beijingensis]